MAMLHGFPYFEVQFTKQGDVHDPGEVSALTEFLAHSDTTDLVVIAHGWNNDMDAARSLYDRFFEQVRAELDSSSAPGLSNRTFAVLGVLWPSKKFADEDLIPSGAAGAESPVTDDVVQRELELLKGGFDPDDADAVLDQAKALVPRLEDSPRARREFVQHLRGMLPPGTMDDEGVPDALFNLDGDELLKRLSLPVDTPPSPAGAGTGGAAAVGTARADAAGGAAWLSLGGIKAGAFKLLNYLTYYQMKERAGTIGSGGVNQLLRTIRGVHPNLKLHLIGHSFGGRLVTAAVVGPPDQPAVRVETLTLLQAAFSHNGFAQQYDGQRDGFFRQLVTDGMVTGPVLITCTSNDTAVGVAYPIASRIANQAASAIGDENDPYGGIGRNGAQHTPEAVKGKLLAADGDYHQFEARKLYNLNADQFIADHGDICRREVAHALVTAVQAM